MMSLYQPEASVSK